MVERGTRVRDRHRELAAWPLIGRADELTFATRAVTDGTSVVMTGAAGVGKTRLAHDLVDAVATSAHAVSWIAATDAASRIPFGAVAQLIPRDGVTHDRAETLRQIASALEAEAAGRRVLLGVDDAHLLDDASAALVHMLVRAGLVTAVVTFRSGEPVSDSVTALWKDHGAPLIALQTLAREEVEALVASVLEGPVEGATMQRLWLTSEGNALFLRELVQLGFETGALRRNADLWRWSGRFEPGERLTQLVARRLQGIAPAERRALELIAVGEPLAPASLDALGVRESAGELARRALVGTVDGDGREVRLTHPLFGEVVRAGIPALHLDEVRMALAAAVDATRDGADDHNRMRVAMWRAQCGDVTHLDELRWAARRAWVLWDAAGAERLARAALQSGPDLEAGYLLGEALSDLGRPEEALAAFAVAGALPGPDRLHAAIAMAQAGVLANQLERPEEAAALLRSIHGVTRDEPSRRRIVGAMALNGFDVSELVSGSDDEPELEAMSGTVSAPGFVLGRALSWTVDGRVERALTEIDGALASAAAWGDDLPTVAVLLGMTRVWALALVGRVVDAELEADSHYRAAVSAQAEYPIAGWSFVRGMVATLRGMPAIATAALLEATAGYGGVDRGFVRPTSAYLAMAMAAAGRAEDARAALESGADANRSLDRLFEGEIVRAGAWVRAAAGEPSAARAEAHAAADLARSAGQAALEALALHDVARFGDSPTVVDRLTVLTRDLEGVFFPALAEHVRGLAADDGDLLVAASRRFESSGFVLPAAEAAAAAVHAYRRAARNGSAAAARLRAADLAVLCAPACTPQMQVSAEASDLTTREREVATRAATGQSSRAIAVSLGIAVRTVDNLLGRVYLKLGVSGRAELAGVIGADPDGDATPRT